MLRLDPPLSSLTAMTAPLSEERNFPHMKGAVSKSMDFDGGVTLRQA